MADEKEIKVEPVDGNTILETKKEARKVLKEHDYKVKNGAIDSFVSLKDINKIYPNGVQAVYNFNLDISKNDFIVLVGPSGCGKSTTLRMIAGLEEISSGYLYIDQVLSNYLASKDRDISMVFQSYALYPQMTVFDNIAFPLRIRKHLVYKFDKTIRVNKQVLKALENKDATLRALAESTNREINVGPVADYIATRLDIMDEAAKVILDLGLTAETYDEVVSINKAKLEDEIVQVTESYKGQKFEGREITGVDEDGSLLVEGEKVLFKTKLTKKEIRDRVFEAARILDLGPYLDRRPNELSGGQMQRVALGRAIVRNAKLFLMDEPLSNLDAKLRVQMRSEIVRIHEQIGATTVYVTHDQTEAMTMATRIIVMSQGFVQQIGVPSEVYANPKNIFVATFIGSPAMNIISGTYKDGVVKFPNGYSIKMKKAFVTSHKEFYEKKLAECEHMMMLLDISKEVQANEIFKLIDESIRSKKMDETFAKKVNQYVLNQATNSDYNIASVVQNIRNITTVKGALEYLEKLFADFPKDNKEVILKAIAQAKANLESPKEALNAAFDVLSIALYNVNTVTNADLAKIYSARAFADEAKKKDSAPVLSYKKRKGNDKKKKVNRKHRPIIDVKEAMDFVTKLIIEYQKALSGEEHEIKIGIRPENMHLANEFTKASKSESFTINPSIVELLGSELLLHADWCGKDVIAKISTGTIVKAKTDVELVMDVDKVHIFDACCGETIE